MYQEQATPDQTRALVRLYIRLARRARITERKMAASLYTGRALELYTRRNG